METKEIKSEIEEVKIEGVSKYSSEDKLRLIDFLKNKLYDFKVTGNSNNHIKEYTNGFITIRFDSSTTHRAIDIKCIQPHQISNPYIFRYVSSPSFTIIGNPTHNCQISSFGGYNQHIIGHNSLCNIFSKFNLEKINFKTYDKLMFNLIAKIYMIFFSYIVKQMIVDISYQYQNTHLEPSIKNNFRKVFSNEYKSTNGSNMIFNLLDVSNIHTAYNNINSLTDNDFLLLENISKIIEH